MTISAVAAPIILVGNGSATEFAFPWLVTDDDHLSVWLYDTETETQVLIDPTLYSVGGIGDEDGGAVTYPLNGGSPLSSDEWLIIEPAVPYTQEFSPTNQRDYLPASLEGQLDHTTRQVQQLKDRTDRMPLLLVGETFEQQLTRKADLVGKVLGFDMVGEPFAMDPGSVVLAVPGDGTVDFDKLAAGTIATAPEVRLAATAEKLATPASLRTHQEGFGDHPSWYGITFDGVTDDDAGWSDVIEAFNLGDTKSLFLPSGASVINTALDAIIADDVTIAGHLKSSTLRIHEDAGNLGTFFTVGSADELPARFGLSGVVLQCLNTADLDAASGHAITLHAANRPTIKDVEILNAAGFLRCGVDGGLVANATVENARGTVWLDAGVSIYHFERMNGGYFANCSVTGNLNPVTVPATFAGMKFIPTRGLEHDGNIFYGLKMNFAASTPPCPVLLIDVTDGSLDNTRFTDSTLDLVTGPVVHIRAAAGDLSAVTIDTGTDIFTTPSPHGLSVGSRVVFSTSGSITGLTVGEDYWVIEVPASVTFKVSTTANGASVDVTAQSGTHAINWLNRQVTRLAFQNCRLTPSVTASTEHPAGNENPALYIENPADVPMHTITFKDGVLGLARGPAVVIEGVADSTKTTLNILDTSFNDRASGGGAAKPCVQTNVGGLRVQGCNIVPVDPSDVTEITYMVDFTAAATPFFISGNDATFAASGPVNTSYLTTTIQRGQHLKGNLGTNGPFQADRRVTTTDATVTTIAQVPLVDARTYNIHVKHLAVQSTGAARQQNEGVFEFYRTGGGGATLVRSNMIVPQPTYYTGSAAYAGGIVNTGVGVTVQVTATGAALGDFVDAVSFSTSLAGLTVTGFVSAANTVDVRFQNGTAGNITPVGTTYVRVRSNAAASPAWGGLTMDASGNFARVRVTGAAATTINHAVIVDVLSGGEV